LKTPRLLPVLLTSMLVSACAPPKVPDVTGRESKESEELLTRKGYQVKIRREGSFSVPFGRVISQTPEANTESSKGSPVTLVVSDGIKILGTFTLRDTMSSSVRVCEGRGGYSDVRQGMGVTVKDQDGKILGTTRLSEGEGIVHERYDSLFSGCRFYFELKGLPKTDFYELSAGRRGSQVYSLEQLERVNGEVSLGLGDD